VIVASDGLYTLVYQPSERKRLRHYVGGAGEVVHPGWSGFGPHGSLITVADETKIAISVGAPSCFLQYRQYARAIHSFASSSH
jgi:hypothetical protein